MARPEGHSRLIEWARKYLHDRAISHHSQIDDDELAEAFRAAFAVPAFARLQDLRRLCAHLGVGLGHLPNVSDDLFAINAWYEGAAPTIKMRTDVAASRMEHTLGHEIREVIENAFKRASQSYRGLDTNDNRRMNPHSDRFASALLMPTEESRDVLSRLGYDLVVFSKETGRSLPSAVVRSESLFPVKARRGPLAAVWLFEADWLKVRNRKSTIKDLILTQTSFMNGFSTQPGDAGYEGSLKGLFPPPRSNAYDQSTACDALIRRRPSADLVMSEDRFAGRNDFFLIAEPLSVRGWPWRVLLTAIWEDETRLQAQPWVDRVLTEGWVA